MKKCQRCGHENEDYAKFCGICGEHFQNTHQPQTNQNETYQQPNEQLDFQPDKQPTEYEPTNTQPTEYQPTNTKPTEYQPTNTQPTEYQQQYNNQESTYQPSYQPHTHKNVWIAVILDIVGALIFYFLCGIGQLYLGLYKRGIVLCLLGFVPIIVNVICVAANHSLIGSIVSLLIGIVLIIFAAYDAFKCTHAINEGQPIPLLFGSLDLQ